MGGFAQNFDGQTTPQSDDVKPHTHGITDPGHYHSTSFTQNNETGTYRYLSNAGGNNANRPITTTSAKTGITINNSTGTETRPKNYTVRVWLRTA